jgi:rhamnulokinase
MARMVAVDLGAQSGRVAVGTYDGERLSITDVHRFPNVPVRVGGTLYWDILRLYRDVCDGFAAAAQDGPVDSVGVDSWGVDFGLLDAKGRLLQNPVHYRDARRAAATRNALKRIPARELYERTGIQHLSINTIFELAALAAADEPVLEIADTLLLIPDLFHHWLAGTRVSELTNATTTQCFDPRAGAWASDVLECLDIPTRILPPTVAPATVLGRLPDRVADETRLGGALLVAVATHDTASAVAAVPFRRPGSAYISAGTWSLVGVEADRPHIDDETFAANLTNEGGIGGTTRLLRNVAGLWLLHECRRTWELEGRPYAFDELIALAAEAPPLRALIDPDDSVFAEPGDMPHRIRTYCSGTGQDEPEGPGAVVRCILESLALKHRRTIELLRKAAGAAPCEVHVVGGGAHNELLCRWTADATGLPVLAGPAEATSVGNLLVQAIALEELSSLDDARNVVRASFEPTVYEPGETALWDEGNDRFERVLGSAPARQKVGA